MISCTQDDPIVAKDAIPLDVIRQNPNIILASFERGGAFFVFVVVGEGGRKMGKVIPNESIRVLTYPTILSYTGHVGFPSGFFYPFLSAECWSDKVISEYIGSLLSNKVSHSHEKKTANDKDPMKARL